MKILEGRRAMQYDQIRVQYSILPTLPHFCEQNSPYNSSMAALQRALRIMLVSDTI